MNDGKAGIIDSFRDGDSLRVAIDRQQASLRSQLGENQALVTAAAKGTINVDTVRTNIQAVNGFIQKYRSVFIIFHHFTKTNPAGAPTVPRKRTAQRRYLP